MSQKLSLVKYALENEIPIDESSQLIKSTYIPDELVDLFFQNNLSSEVEIKESSGDNPDIPVVFISDIEGAKHEVEAQLTRFVKVTHEQVSGDLLIDKELDNSYRDLLIFLKIREILKLKQEKHAESSQIKLVVG